MARKLCVLVLGWLALSCATAQEAPPRTAKLVLRNGAVYTVNAKRDWAQAVAIDGGKLVYVGDDAGVAKWIGKETAVIDLKGRMVLPGFQDSHVHLLGGGIELNECDLNGAGSEAAILERVKKFAADHPQAKWIRGGGWDLPSFKDGNPHKSLLDKVVPDRPVFLSASDGHSAWANSRALEIAGITAETEDPEHGRIERDPVTKEPTGTLREDAIGLVSRRLPKYTPEEVMDGARKGLQLAAGFGITSIQEASASKGTLDTYGTLEKKGELTVRVVAAIGIDPEEWEESVKHAVALRRKHSSTMIRPISVKIFMDGVIESRTAALLEPYTDAADSRGTANAEAEDLNACVAAADKEGFQVHVHAIGDRAVRMSLDAFEHARKANGARDSRHQIAHLQLIHPKDWPRFKDLGVLANFQAFWMIEDAWITTLTYPRLGPERSKYLYPMGSVAKAGATIVGGSDWSVTSLDPLGAIQVGVTRRSVASDAGPAWMAGELVGLDTMIAAYTINGALANFQEKSTGSLEAGKSADLVVLDRNLFKVAAHEIAKTKVQLTLLGGREVYRAATFGKE